MVGCLSNWSNLKHHDILTNFTPKKNNFFLVQTRGGEGETGEDPVWSDREAGAKGEDQQPHESPRLRGRPGTFQGGGPREGPDGRETEVKRTALCGNIKGLYRLALIFRGSLISRISRI